MAKGQYTEAATKFDELGSYEEASKLSMYCKAAAVGEAGDFETAKNTFTILGDYKESQYMLIYYTAREAEASVYSGYMIYGDKWFDAIRGYESIALFRDSKERAEACRKAAYDQAIKSGDDGDHSFAIALLNRLGEYNDSRMQVKYYEAKQLVANGSYREGANAFSAISTFRDSATLSGEALEKGYTEAENKEKAGNLAEAKSAFLALGDYKDSSTRAYKLYYDAGVSLMAEKKWDEAIVAFTAAESYSDASSQISESYYQKALEKKNKKEWDAAIEAFTNAGYSYSDANTQIKSIYYEQGMIAVEDKDWALAESLFEKAGNYEDAATQVKKAYYSEGTEKLKSRDYDGAAACFVNAGDYEDASTQYKETRYQQANQHMNIGRYDEAYVVFSEIRDYSDVNSILESNSNMLKAKERAEWRATIKVGSKITYGHYEQDANEANGKEPIEWLVLNVSEKNALLISVYVLDYHSNSFDIHKEGEWKSGAMYKWLNSDFKNAAFSAEELKQIEEITLLDRYQAEKYFKSNSERRCTRTKWAKETYPYKWEITYCSWALSGRGVFANYDRVVTDSGEIDSWQQSSRNVRPVIYIKMY